MLLPFPVYMQGRVPGRRKRGKTSLYLPDRSKGGEDAVEDLVRFLASDIVQRLNELEQEVDFQRLLAAEDGGIRQEAIHLYQQIESLRSRLADL